MMVISFQLSTVSAKAGSFFSRFGSLLPGFPAPTGHLTNKLCASAPQRETISCSYDTRDTGFALDEDYSVTYTYDMFGRFHSVSSSVQSAQSVVEYSRLADTDLLSGRSVEIGNSLLAVGYSYESARSLITSVSNLVNHVNPVLISAYDYANDELGRRISIARSGLAFGNLPVRDAYGYNPRSEVTSARRTPIGSQTELRGFSYDYEYDPIGNRTTSTEYDHEGSALVSEYTANALNQYGQRTVPGYAGVRGSATNTATVTVNGNPAWRLDEYFYGGDDADNSADAVMKQLEITAVQSNLYSAVTGRVFVARTPEAFTYDTDGNLTQDGRFGYTWNGENRLTKAETRDDLPVAVPRVKVEYAYDHQGRRVATATYAWTNDAWQAVESRAFLYDGWNVVTELTHSQTHTLTNCYTWGLDLSGSLQGAGGVGGLLAASLDGTTALYCYDANGNVSQLVAPSGEILANYEYSPFGETVVSTGPLAKANPFRFSTKWFDNATALGDWGYRWYSPNVGRWASRDPLEEEGGLNRYVFTANMPIGHIDLLGLLCTYTDDFVSSTATNGAGARTFFHYKRPRLKKECPDSQMGGKYNFSCTVRVEFYITSNDPNYEGTAQHEAKHVSQAFKTAAELKSITDIMGETCRCIPCDNAMQAFINAAINHVVADHDYRGIVLDCLEGSVTGAGKKSACAVMGLHAKKVLELGAVAANLAQEMQEACK